MRKEEGFELANIEAPLANARPICLCKHPYLHFFTKDDYRNEHALESLWVHEDPETMKDPLSVEDQLVGCFEEKERLSNITAENKRYFVERFNWRDTVEPFWKRVIEQCQTHQQQ
jgi:hypothetical protein